MACRKTREVVRNVRCPDSQNRRPDPATNLEEGVATHSSILAWRIPWTEEPGELQLMGLQRVEHNRETNTYVKRKNSAYKEAL